MVWCYCLRLAGDTVAKLNAVTKAACGLTVASRMANNLCAKAEDDLTETSYWAALHRQFEKTLVERRLGKESNAKK